MLVRSGSAAAHVCLSAEGSCILAEPDIHLLPQAPKSRRRRLSLCSLPVPKQFEESLGSCLLRPAGNLRDLAVCASCDPDVFPLLGRVSTLPRFAGTRRQARSPCSVSPRPACGPPSCAQRPVWPDCCCLAAVLSRRATQVRHCSAEPVWLPPPAPAGCVCSAAWRWACASSCRPNSSRRCIARSS